MMCKKYVIGVDFGSDSSRAVVVDAATGETVGSGEAFYTRWKKGLYQHPELGVFRQHPLDYLEAIESCVTKALQCLDQEEKSHVVGIGVDTTGSTPVPVDREGTPLSLLKEFEENENAMFHLWKDHSAFAEAEEINEIFKNGSEIDYTKYQGNYCAEWYWAKILHAVRADERIREAAYTWEEHSDWMVGVLCGETRPEHIFHGACAAGHKAYWHSEWGGLPAAHVFEKLDPYLVLVRERYGRDPQPAVTMAGRLCPEWAQRLGLSTEVAVSGSSFDAHAGAVGAGIRENTMICTMGTSAVDMIVEKAERLKGKNMKHFCGQAEDSILPDMVGVETGQAAFGDIFAWFKKLLLWPLDAFKGKLDPEIYEEQYRTLDEQILIDLQKAAEKLPDEPFPISLDWFNGRRYPDTDDFQRAFIGGLRLGMEPPYLYRALVFGAICGMKRIVDGFEDQEIQIHNVIAVGGISRKSEYVMQMMADVLGKKVAIVDALQTCALGAAIYAAVGSGVYATVDEAIRHMAAKEIYVFEPCMERNAFYRKHYEDYLRLAEFADQWKQHRV
ncbi:MAG: ribulokinase [Eubacteriales bacterium]|nr:ribulokinase [Eubacteriales bacterium]